MKKVLIIKFSALGDIVMASPHIEAICEYHKNDQVWILTSSMGENLFGSHPHLRVLNFNRNQWFGKKNFRNALNQIKKNEFAIVYDLQGNRLSRKFVKKSNVRSSVGTQPNTIYTYHPVNAYTQDMNINVYDRLNESIISAGLSPAVPIGKLYVPRDSIQKVIQFRNDNQLQPQKYICIHPGSASDWPSKRWPKEFFREIAQRFEDRRIRVLWIGSKEDVLINKWLGKQIGINTTQLFSPIEVYELGTNAIGALANDSGPMHLLAAANIPVFGFFGPTNPHRSHGLGQKQRVIYNNSPCSPCFSGKCKKGKNHMCLADISPQTVWDKIKSEINFDS